MEYRFRGSAFCKDVRKALIAALLATTAVIGGSAAPQSQALAQAQTSFNIPAGPLNRVLAAFGRQSGIQLSYEASIASGKTSPGIQGAATREQAIARILQGSGLSYSFKDSRNVLITQPGATATGAAPAGAIALDTIDVEGATRPGRTEGTESYTTSQSSFGKGQSLRELPQTVTVMTHQRMRDQGLRTLEDVMEYTPGITVEQQSSSSSGFYSRGFEITNFQIDGNSPLLSRSYSQTYAGGLTTSQADLAMYDSVEVLRGSDALYGVSGAPGGVINLVRKKPTSQFQMNALARGGSWNNYRGELDVSGSLNANGAVRGRFVGVYEDREFFYNVAKSNKYLLYGIVEADVTDSTMLTFGSDIMRQDGSNWRYGLPRYSNGADIGLPRSTFLAPDENRWLRNTTKQFVRLDQELGDKWTLGIEASRAHSKVDEKTQVFWGAIDPITLSGLRSGTGHGRQFYRNETQSTLDAVLKGSFHLLGMDHKLTLGANIIRYDSGGETNARNGGTIFVPNIFEFDPADFRLNDPYFRIFQWATKITQKGVYGSLAAKIADPLTLIVGGRLSWYNYDDAITTFDRNTGNITGTTLTRFDDNKVFTPSLGLVYDFSTHWSAYASFAETYQPQANSLSGPLPGTPLGPVTGRTYETGVKGSLLDGRLNTSIALYHVNRNGEAVPDPAYPPVTGDLGRNCCFLGQGRIVSRGVDAEVSGEIAEGWRVQAGYTFNDNENVVAGGRYSTVTPKHLFKLWTTYALRGPLDGWKVGGGVTAQSSFYRKGEARTLNPNTGEYDGPLAPFEFTEPGRAVVDLYVEYKINQHWSATLNVNNVFDKRYYQTMGYADYANWYGPPRNFLLSARARF